ncbi:NACHT domain-containing protein [Streptosporangiaceae bacterium NEAU-GS5]|nr:NACHT domain-containing protein [Streptosporangiaceae bacterium NEAU-GS5]
MARRSGSWKYGFIFWIGLAALAALLAVIGLSFYDKGGLQTAANVAQLVGVVFAIPALVAGLWRWRHSATAAGADPEKVARALDILAGLVSDQWRTESIRRSLDDPAPIPVQWRLTTRRELMDHPVNMPGPAFPLTASSDDIAELAGSFRALGRRRLVILGVPGSGKTTLAVQLLLELLGTRASDEPVPVLLSVAGWDPTAHPRLQDWLTVRLSQDYPSLGTPGLGPGIPAILADRGHILPILDGLDELPTQAQAAIIAAVNRSLAGSDQLILTSRTAEYGDAVGAAGDVLTSAVVIEPQPLEPFAAADYLYRCLPPEPGPAWERLLAELSATTSGTPVAEMAERPLGLWLLRTVYISPGADPAPLLDPARFPDAGALRANLFAQLIPALITAHPPSRDPADLFRPRHRRHPARVRDRLTYLAHHMIHRHPAHGLSSRDFAWWHLARTTNAISWPVKTALGIPGGLMAGLLFAYLFGIELAFTGGWPAAGIAVGAVTVFVGWLAGWRGPGKWSRQAPGFADLHLRGQAASLMRRLGFGLMYGLGGSLLFGLVYSLVATLARWLGSGFGGDSGSFLSSALASGAVALLAGLPIGLAYGLVRWAEQPTEVDRATTPMTSWRRDRTLNLTRAACPVVIVGLPGLALGLSMESTLKLAVITASVVLALVYGLVVGFMIGRHHAWMAYVIATYRLAWSRRLPRRLMRFRDDMHRLGLLRAIGPVYQFRHAELQDHLAATYRPRRPG